MASYSFKLYVTGDSPRSSRAIENLERLCERELDDDCEVEVVDVQADPDRAETDRILTTPTLIKAAPKPVRRLTGDLTDERAVLHALGLGRGVRQDGPNPKGT